MIHEPSALEKIAEAAEMMREHGIDDQLCILLGEGVEVYGLNPIKTKFGDVIVHYRIDHVAPKTFITMTEEGYRQKCIEEGWVSDGL